MGRGSCRTLLQGQGDRTNQRNKQLRQGYREECRQAIEQRRGTRSRSAAGTRGKGEEQKRSSGVDGGGTEDTGAELAQGLWGLDLCAVEEVKEVRAGHRREHPGRPPVRNSRCQQVRSMGETSRPCVGFQFIGGAAQEGHRRARAPSQGRGAKATHALNARRMRGPSDRSRGMRELHERVRLFVASISLLRHLGYVAGTS